MKIGSREPGAGSRESELNSCSLIPTPRSLLPLLLAVILLVPVAADDIKRIESDVIKLPEVQKRRIVYGFAGLGFQYFFEEAGGSAPNPVNYSFYFGAYFNVLQKSFWGLQIAVSDNLYTSYYMWDDEFAALPVEIENRSATVIGNEVSLILSPYFIASSKVRILPQVIVMADLRIVLLANDLHPLDPVDEITANNAKLQDWFWQDAHWLFLGAGLGVNLQAWRRIALGIELNVLFPAAPPPGNNGIRTGGNIKIVF